MNTFSLFVVIIKKTKTGQKSLESSLPLELNEYLDTILGVLYRYGGDRKMVITSFHPDVCAM